MQPIIDLSIQMPGFFVALSFIVSLMIGSFLNVVIYRLPVMMERNWKQEYQSYFHPDEPPAPSPTFNLVKPDSTCPKCQHKIRAWENIPVVSWLFLGGKCANCKTDISIRYPAIELLTAILAGFAAWQLGPSQQALIAILVTYFLVAMTFIDLDKMLLPDQLTLPLLWIGLIISPFNVFVSPVDAIIGASVGYLSLWSVYWLFKLLTGKEGMGFGDFKLLAALGAFVGWQGLPIIILLSSFVGAIIGVALMIKQKAGTSLAIPFGPYLAIAGWLTLLYKQDIIDLYLQWVLG